MPLSTIGRQASAGVIVGISVVVYAITYGALMFAGPLSAFVGYGITAGLIAGAVGALYGLLSEEKTFVSGPDSNTISVLASTLAVLGSLGFTQAATLNHAIAMIFATAIVCAAAFYVFARPNLSGLIRYIPFSVMAGFLASTGWLMASGALNLISGTPLTLAGWKRLASDPMRPELAFALVVVAALYALAPRLSGAVLIPLIIVGATVIVNLFLASGICTPAWCSPERWMFTGLDEIPWMPPWQLDLAALDVGLMILNLPGMLVVAFVGILTIVLSLASLELSFEREFDLNRALKAHAVSSALCAALGGFIGIISLSRTALNHQTKGGILSGAVAAAMCLATLFGAGAAVGYISRGALGGLILYLGLNMLKQWVWDQRRTTSRIELAQIVLILALTANYGFLVGFAAGVLIACVIFVVTYSRIPLADLATNLSRFASTVVRPQHELETLKAYGHKTVIYRLAGYVFFGSASRIDSFFQAMNVDEIEGVILDFSNVSGIDRSAIGVFQRILRRYHARPIRFYFVHADSNKSSLKILAQGPIGARNLCYFPSLDYALETAEEHVLTRHGAPAVADDACFAFIDSAAEREIFASHCERRAVAKDAALCAEGDLSNEVFFVESGSFDIIKSLGDGASVRLAQLRQGAIAGELAFYTGEARSASIRAVVESSVYVLHRDAHNRMRTVHPELATKFDHVVIRKIAGSLTRTNTLIATLG